MNGRFKRLMGLGLIVVLTAAAPASAVTVGKVLSSDKGIVAAAHPLAAAAGAEVLEAGGNAIDAAIATSLALGVVEPYASSLFGEGYMVARMADGRTWSIDFRSCAPAMASYEQMAQEGFKTTGEMKLKLQGACVPGLPAGIREVMSRGATKPLTDLAAPAIRYAEDGFEVNRTFSQICKDNFKTLSENAPDFLNEGLAWESGETFKNPKLAATLRRLAEKGLDDFYSGSVADDIDAFMKEKGGWIRKEDLQAYRAVERTPLQGRYKGYNITVAGLPVGGPRLIENMNLFENFNFAAMGWDDPLRLHIMQEVFLLTASDLSAYVGDPAFSRTAERGMANKEYAKLRLMSVKLSGATTSEDWAAGKSRAGDAPAFEEGMGLSDYLTLPAAAALPAQEQFESASTTHFSVVDRWGNAVAWTQTISGFFGTGYWLDGFFLNNEMGNFWSRPSPGGNGVSDIQPGKRVRTTISPMIVDRAGKVRWVLGTPGAGRIVPTLCQMLIDLIDFNMSLEESINSPKIMSSFNSGEGVSLMEMESGYSEGTIRALEQGFGHKVEIKKFPDLYFGGPNAIERGLFDGRLTGVGSVRRGGAAAAPDN